MTRFFNGGISSLDLGGSSLLQIGAEGGMRDVPLTMHQLVLRGI